MPSASTFLAMYFTLTGLHALARRRRRGRESSGRAPGATASATGMTAGRVHALALYWAFVDVVWLVILVLFYLS